MINSKLRKAREKASKVLSKEEEYFIRIQTELKKLLQLAVSGAKTSQVLTEMKKHVRRIRRRERWEQWRASTNKLGDKIRGIPMSASARDTIQSLIRDMRALEMRIIVTDTMHNLGKEILEKKSHLEVNWGRVKESLEQALKDVLGIIQAEEQTRKLLLKP